MLGRDAWIPAELRAELADMAGFRNVLVQGYDDVDLAVVRDVLTNHLVDLSDLAERVRNRIGEDIDRAAAPEPSANE